MKTKEILLGMVLTGIISSCGSNPNKAPKATEVPIGVTVKKMTLLHHNVRFQYSGKVHSDDQTKLSTKLLGQVSHVLVDEGDQVSKGQLLVQIKGKEVESKLASAKASLKEAKAAQVNTQKNFNRINNLFGKGSATQVEFDDAKTALTMINAKVESAEENIAELQELLTYANLRSPINGFVSERFMNAGDLASPGLPILALESMSQLNLDINVPEFEIHLFETGHPVTIRFNALDGKVYQGLVHKVVPSTAFSGAQFIVSIDITNADKAVKPGMYGKVSMLKDASAKLILSDSLIHNRGQLKGVFVVSEDNEALLRWLRLGRQSEEGFEVLSGLEEGDIVITSSESKLINGQKVKALNQIGS